jgi:hypothetical protein
MRDYSSIKTLIEHPEGIGLYGSDLRWNDANYAVTQSLAQWYRVPDADSPAVRALFGDTSNGLHYGEYLIQSLIARPTKREQQAR